MTRIRIMITQDGDTDQQARHSALWLSIYLYLQNVPSFEEAPCSRGVVLRTSLKITYSACVRVTWDVGRGREEEC